MHDDLGSQATGPSDFKIGDWWVRPRQNELEKLGETVSVEGRSMSVLVALARHAPSVVSKERLISEVWSDSPFVSDDVITHAIWELRKALGDSGKKKQYIRTFPRKGYGLVAEVLRPQGSPLPLEGARIDHYDLGREIGRGAMGVVFEAVDRRLDRTVAVKFLAGELTRDLKACQRFEREARLAASLDHPNLATVHEIGETSDGHRYLVLPYYSGGSLEDRLSQGPLPLHDAVSMIRQLLDGLSVAHERDIVHRDIKPANLLLDAHGTLKICDFGIAKLLGATDLTETGGALGTPAYKSPEQALGRAVDHRTDLWSSAVVFFELLTGKRPVEGQGSSDGLKSLLGDASVEASRLEGLVAFFEKGLAEDVERRFQSAADMSEALSCLTGLSGGKRPSWMGWLVLGLGLVLLVVGIGFGFGWLFFDRNPERALTEAQESSNRYLQLATSHWLEGNHKTNLDRTQELLEKSVKLWPESATAKAHLAAFLADRSGMRGLSLTQKNALRREARTLAIEVSNQGAGSALGLATLARLTYLASNYPLAEAWAHEAIRLEPDCDQGETCDLAYVWLGEILWSLDRKDEAIAVLEEGEPYGGGLIRCNLKLAQLYKNEEQFYEAETAYRQVLEYDLDQSTALTDLALLFFYNGRYDEALPLLQSAYAQTSDPTMVYNIGVIQYSKEYWDAAAKSFETAQKGFEAEDRPFPLALVALGDIQLELGKALRANAYFTQAAIAFEEENSPGRRRRSQRAVCLAKLGRFEQAKTIIEPILNDPVALAGFPAVLSYAARIFALEGDERRLFDLARQWQAEGNNSRLFLDDPAFIPYRKNEAYLRILEPDFLASQ